MGYVAVAHSFSLYIFFLIDPFFKRWHCRNYPLFTLLFNEFAVKENKFAQ